MIPEEILTIDQLRESIFENRKNKVILHGILSYVQRHNRKYTLRHLFEAISMIHGALEIHHNNVKAN